MRKIAALSAALLLLCAGGFARAEETGTAPDEWTVLFFSAVPIWNPRAGWVQQT